MHLNADERSGAKSATLLNVKERRRTKTTRPTPQASVVINAHAEGGLLQITLNNVLESVSIARHAGFAVEIILVADEADKATAKIVTRNRENFDDIFTVGFRELGQSRQFGIEAARGELVFMHDADDLFSRNWHSSALSMLRDGKFDDKSVYHTSHMVGFQCQTYIREMISSTDPDFDWLALVTDWFFSNKAVAHRSLFRRFPIPHNDHKNGLGSEDWSWASDTIASGVSHELIPDTICFYRHKKPQDSLGMTPGLIHRPSPLYDPTNVRENSRGSSRGAVASSAYAAASHGSLHFKHRSSPSPPWLIAELQYQTKHEPRLGEVLAAAAQPDKRILVEAQPIQRGVGKAYRRYCSLLDNRPKTIVSISEDLVSGGDRIFEKVAYDIQEKIPERQLILFSDGINMLAPEEFSEQYGACLISTRLLSEWYKIPVWQISRFLLRFLLQTEWDVWRDFCSDLFSAILVEFPLVIKGLEKPIQFYHLDRLAGIYGQCSINLQRGISVAKQNSFLDRVSATIASDQLRAIWAGAGVNTITPDAGDIEAVEIMVRSRFREDFLARAAAFRDWSFMRMFSPPPETVRSEENDKLSRPVVGRGQFHYKGTAPKSTWLLAAKTPMTVFANCAWEAAQLEFLRRPQFQFVVPEVIYSAKPTEGVLRFIEWKSLRHSLDALIDASIHDNASVPFLVFARDSPLLREAMGITAGREVEMDLKEILRMIELAVAEGRCGTLEGIIAIGLSGSSRSLS